MLFLFLNDVLYKEGFWKDPKSLRKVILSKRKCLCSVPELTGITWSTTAICKTFLTSCRTGRTLYDERWLSLENHLRPSHSINAMVEYHPISAPVVPLVRWTSRQFGKEVLPGIFLKDVLYTESGKERVGRRHRGAGNFGRVRNPCSKAQCRRSNNAAK